MVPRKPSTATIENTSYSAEAEASRVDTATAVEIALVKRDVENLQKNVDEIKNKMAEKEDLAVLQSDVKTIKANGSKIIWIVIGALALQVVAWLLRGGLHGIPVPRTLSEAPGYTVLALSQRPSSPAASASALRFQ